MRSLRYNYRNLYENTGDVEFSVEYPDGGRTGGLVQWLKMPAWKVGDRGLEPTLANKF